VHTTAALRRPGQTGASKADGMGVPQEPSRREADKREALALGIDRDTSTDMSHKEGEAMSDEMQKAYDEGMAERGATRDRYSLSFGRGGVRNDRGGYVGGLNIPPVSDEMHDAMKAEMDEATDRLRKKTAHDIAALEALADFERALRDRIEACDRYEETRKALLKAMGVGR